MLMLYKSNIKTYYILYSLIYKLINLRGFKGRWILLMHEEFWSDIGKKTPELIDSIFRLSRRSCIAITRLDNSVTWWSEKAVELFGLSGRYSGYSEEKTELDVHKDDREMYCKAILNRFKGKNHDMPIEYRVKLPDEGYTMFSARTMFMNDDEGKPMALITMFNKHNISYDIDVVTGLHTEAVFTRKINQFIDENKSALLIKIGLDRFCNINVIYGSEYADRVLYHVAEKLTEIVGKSGEVYRLSGAKFAIFFESISKEELAEVYARITSALSNDVRIDQKKVPLKISAGAVMLEEYMDDANAVKSRLTYALDISRHEHHGGLVMSNNTLDVNGSDNIELISVIHQCALKECDGFFMCYQPIVEASSGEIKGMEALVRWEKEPYGLVPPGVFIEWLEEDPCIFELGNWIIRQSVKDASEILNQKPDFFINVNISGAQIERSEFRETLLGILDEYNFPHGHFCMELTERCRLLDIGFLKREIEYFKACGIKVAMDDFGTGNASLNVVLELPVDELKIDMSFVKDIKNKPFNQAIVESIVSFANTTNLEVCIEGVENEEVREYLAKFDADWHQGYHYSKPVTIEYIRNML